MDESSPMEDVNPKHDLPEDQGHEGKVFLAKSSFFICCKNSHYFIHHPGVIFHNSQSIRRALLHSLSSIGRKVHLGHALEGVAQQELVFFVLVDLLGALILNIEVYF